MHWCVSALSIEPLFLKNRRAFVSLVEELKAELECEPLSLNVRRKKKHKKKQNEFRWKVHIEKLSKREKVNIWVGVLYPQLIVSNR